MDKFGLSCIESNIFDSGPVFLGIQTLLTSYWH